jgi:hypothetical protein
MNSTKQITLAGLFFSLTAVAVCLVFVGPRPQHWWDLDQGQLTLFVRSCLENSRRVAVVRVTHEAVLRSSVDVDKVTVMKMAKTFKVLSEEDSMPACADYISVVIVNDKRAMSFDVYKRYIMFGDGKWVCCRGICKEFVEVLESVVGSQGVM